MRIYFKEDTHQYFNQDGKQYISVSALTKKLEKPKDWDEIKRKYAKKHNLSVREVTKNWERKATLGKEAGTIYHIQREIQLLDSPQENDKAYGRIVCPVEDGLKWSFPIEKLEDNTIYPELIIYDHKHAVCGQSDKVVVEDGIIHLSDYKTDKSIERKAYSSDWVRPEKLLKPVDYLDNCNYNLYSLKMSMYMYMLWNLNKHFKVGNITLEHVELERDDEGVPILINKSPIVKNITIIDIPYKKEAVRNIFDYYQQGKL